MFYFSNRHSHNLGYIAPAKKIISALLAIILIFSMCIVQFVSSAPNIANAENANSQSMTDTNWMSYLPDEAKISRINIPGTHDACCYDFDKSSSFPAGRALAKTQYYPIPEQLAKGARFFDIRYSRDKEVNQLVINHGGVICKDSTDGKYLNMSSLLSQCKKFLEGNPSETIILKMQSEEGRFIYDAFCENQSNEFKRLENDLWKTFESDTEHYLKVPYTDAGEVTATLGECRKRIVILTNHYFTEDEIPYSFVNAKEKWNGGTKNGKAYNGIKYYLDNAQEQDYFNYNQNPIKPFRISTDCYHTAIIPCR
ncbi:MAG: hypothetical protein MJ189_00890, partial [Coriobacteriales bacterium]|nr:hypothetical protein [Coriobacteriales bacterium]